MLLRTQERNSWGVVAYVEMENASLREFKFKILRKPLQMGKGSTFVGQCGPQVASL